MFCCPFYLFCILTYTKGVFGTAQQTLLHKLNHRVAPQKLEFVEYLFRYSHNSILFRTECVELKPFG